MAAALKGDLETVKAYVEAGGDVNARDRQYNKGYTLLMRAVKAQSLDLCKYLVSKGADVNLKGTHFKVPESAIGIAKGKCRTTSLDYYDRHILSLKNDIARWETDEVVQKYG